MGTTMAMTEMTTKEAAEELRARLKARGWSQRDVSVRVDSFSSSSLLRVVIRRLGIHKPEVEGIARRFEAVSRDEATGEVLLGGNRHIDVAYDRTVLAPLQAHAAPKLVELAIGDRIRLVVPGKETGPGVTVVRTNEYEFRLRFDGADRQEMAYGPDGAAHRAALVLADVA